MKIGRTNIRFTALAAIAALITIPAMASDTNVVGVEVSEQAGAFRFSVTLRHKDEGWDHYANVWEIIGPDGRVIDRRVLAHPHDTEQPFTRSLGHVEIAPGIKQVTIRGGDNVSGIGGKTMLVKIPGRN